ncbi:hypothetical protein R1sor_004183 [Riccia sorocarpa]|uniref:DOG1 domain-containing protein n=1 Tax=Riccia sorocarpa TaxID=122646 RepID=A0ABD3H5W4_9MARC
MGSVSEMSLEAYAEFQQKWKEEQDILTHELEEALTAGKAENELHQLVRKLEKHYEEYYVAKDGALKHDALRMMQPGWKCPLEAAFMWIGGWRPTTVFQLAYAQAGEQLEEQLTQLLQGLSTPSMASLSSSQLQRISNLQVTTQESEEELTHKEAVLQQGMADQPVLTLAVAAAEEESEDGENMNALKDAMGEKVEALENLIRDADSLRTETLKKMLRILTPIQAAQYLVAAGKLQIGIRKLEHVTPENGGDGEHRRNGVSLHYYSIYAFVAFAHQQWGCSMMVQILFTVEDKELLRDEKRGACYNSYYL